jgi:predicted phage terminase large subunit-like protein
VWRGSAIELPNGVRLEAFGTGQNIRGRRRRQHRPTLIVCDDIQNDRHIDSPRARELSRRWFHGTLLPAGTRRTNVIHLATALHRDALALELHRTPGWRSRLFASIENWPKQMDLWQEWERIYTDLERPDHEQAARRFYEEHRQAMHEDATVLWPEEEDLYSLMCQRTESGTTAFAREKQCAPIAPEECEWPEDYFGPHIWFDECPARLRVKTMAIDPSKGADARHGDYSAIVMLALDAQGNLYVEADLARRPSAQIVTDGVDRWQQFRPDAFAIETNQFQELFGSLLADEFRRRGLPAFEPWAMDNRASKLVRIRRLGPHLASGRVRFRDRSAGTRLLVDQLRDFPVGRHDDGPDAMEMALRLAIETTRSPPADGLGTRLPIS